MGQITKSFKAEQDLIDIWLYIADDNPIEADKVLDKFETSFTKLADFPLIGTVIEELANIWTELEIRHFPVDKYLIIYSVSNTETVEVVRVINSSLDYTRIL